jgi:alcohol dehydrogenase class IV
MVDTNFSWVDAERTIRFGQGTDVPVEHYALLTGASRRLPELEDAADVVLVVPSGPVPEAAAAVREGVGGRPIVAVGGGRVIDAAKGIAGADGLSVAAVPTTLSGAPMTKLHRMPAGVEEWNLVRPSLVIAEPDLMASQEPAPRAASAMNALAHAAEALYGPLANPVAEMAALRAAELLSKGLEAPSEEKARPQLALGAILAGYAVGSAGFALHHLLGQTLVRVTGAPHAGAYAVLLPYTLEAMLPRAPDVFRKLADALGLGTTNPAAVPARVGELGALAGPTRLSELGVEESQLDTVVQEALQRPDLGNTPHPPDAAELRELLEAAL